MSPEDWQRIRPILESALELESTSRSGFLDEVCPESTLRQQIESFISAHDEAEDTFLNRTAEPLLLHEEELRFHLSPGKRIGPYEIVEEIAHGGMGAVYRAVRADGQYTQQVALKVVRADLSGELNASRLRNERQILAGLDHPNIAKILDGGTTSAGLPYFAMELIDGFPITDYCEHQKLPIEARLKMFLQVCAAVQYAHQHLIIHRDIKPSNILITPDGIPKLLDFGIAKILDPAALGSGFERTSTMFQVLTPAYASPEQVKGESITTATDVYSLGVVLYELLAGRHPYWRSETTPQELARNICEMPPEKPSSTVRQRHNCKAPLFPQIATTRQFFRHASDKLSKRLQGDLDNIALMALRKEPLRRYSSPEQFAGDIQRHLENLPVTARKDTARYRAAKFVSRHRAGVAATGMVALTFAVGLGATIREARVARAEQMQAVERFKDVQELASSLIFDVHDAIRDLPGSTPVRRQIVAKALKYLDNLAQQSRNDPAVLRELSAGYRRIGEVDASNLGDPAGALASYRKAQAIREKLLASRDANLDDLIEFAKITRLASTASIRAGGHVSSMFDDNVRAAELLEHARALHPQDIEILRELKWNYETQADLLAGGFDLSHLGDVSGALPPRQKELDLAEQLCTLQPQNPEFQRELAVSLGLMGDLLYALAREQESSQDYARAQQILETLASQSSSPKVRMALYDSYYRGVSMKIKNGDLQGAILDARGALEVANELSKADPKNTMPRLLLAAAYLNIAQSSSWANDRKAAEPAMANALNIDAELVRNNASSNEFRVLQALRFEEVGNAYEKLRENSKALHFYEQALTTFSATQSKDPTDAGMRFYLAATYNGIGSALAQSGRAQEAEQFHRKALSVAEPDAETTPPNEEAQYRTADAYTGLGTDEAMLAAEPRLSRLQRIQHWENSRTYLEQSLKVWGHINRPKLLTPVGSNCIPPAIVRQRLERATRTLRSLQLN